MGIVFSFYVFRLVDWQIVNGQKYLEIANRSNIFISKTDALRGEILDVNGVPFAEEDNRHRERHVLPHGGCHGVRRDLHLCPLRRHQPAGGLRADGVYRHSLLLRADALRDRLGGYRDSGAGGEDR